MAGCNDVVVDRAKAPCEALVAKNVGVTPTFLKRYHATRAASTPDFIVIAVQGDLAVNEKIGAYHCLLWTEDAGKQWDPLAVKVYWRKR